VWVAGGLERGEEGVVVGRAERRRPTGVLRGHGAGTGAGGVEACSQCGRHEHPKMDGGSCSGDLGLVSEGGGALELLAEEQVTCVAVSVGLGEVARARVVTADRKR